LYSLNPKVVEHEPGEIDDALELTLHLLRRAKDVCVILGESATRASPWSTPDFSRPVDGPQLRDPNRQLPVGVLLPLVMSRWNGQFIGLSTYSFLSTSMKVHVLAVEPVCPDASQRSTWAMCGVFTIV